VNIHFSYFNGATANKYIAVALKKTKNEKEKIMNRNYILSGTVNEATIKKAL
jgi:hypothetical protein